MIATKNNSTLTYISNFDIYIVREGEMYNVYNKYTDAWLGCTDMAQMADYKKRMEEVEE